MLSDMFLSNTMFCQRKRGQMVGTGRKERAPNMKEKVEGKAAELRY
jgi:hypothetical protein